MSLPTARNDIERSFHFMNINDCQVQSKSAKKNVCSPVNDGESRGDILIVSISQRPEYTPLWNVIL